MTGGQMTDSGSQLSTRQARKAIAMSARLNGGSRSGGVIGRWSMIIALACSLFLSGCFKEKLMQPPSNTGHGQTQVIEMGPQYTDQFFYSLSSNTVIKHNSRFDYDLMFDCDDDKFNIWLNTAKFMKVWRSGRFGMDSVSLDDTLSLTPFDWRYELGAFNSDSNAIGKWWIGGGSPSQTAGEVYLIDRGVDAEGNSLGYAKLRVNDFLGPNTYSITWSDFVSPTKTMLISKYDLYNYKYVSLSGAGNLIDDNIIEPPRSDWDLCFTRYTIFFYAPYNIGYQVTGVLTNPSRTVAYMDSTVLFDSVGVNNFSENRYQTRRDAIGYEWKRYSSLSADGTYSMNTHYTYYIRTGNVQLYKLRFFDFSRNGIRGYPSFEYYQMQ